MRERKQKISLKWLEYQLTWTFAPVLNLTQETTLGDFCGMRKFSFYFFVNIKLRKKEYGLKEKNLAW